MGMIRPFRSAFTESDWMTANVAVAAGQWMEFGRITGVAGIGYALGYDSMSGQDSANGRFFLDLRDTAAAPGAVVNGDLRIEILDAQDRVQGIVWEGRTETLRTTASDRTKQLPWPFLGEVIGENYKFSFKIKADAGATISATQTDLLMDITTFDDK